MAKLLSGKEVAAAMKERMLVQVEELKGKGIIPGLAIVRLGNRPDDAAYERSAVKKCESIGIRCDVHEYPESLTTAELESEIYKLNADSRVHGILVFRPLPGHIDEDAVRRAVDPGKDVDCMNPVNTAKVFEGDESGFAPCTPEAVMEILGHYGIDVKGKRVVVIGRSLVVGKPLAMLLLKMHATVTVCHTRTADLAGTCRNAEVLIAAAGKARMVDAGFVSEGQIIIDVGINADKDGSLCGDVDFAGVEASAGAITPVPGGVGTVTTSVLAEHVVRAASTMGL